MTLLESSKNNKFIKYQATYKNLTILIKDLIISIHQFWKESNRKEVNGKEVNISYLRVGRINIV